MNFNELKLDERLRRGIADRGYTQLTDVQARTLPIALQGLDVAVQSQTGTGKTAAFLIAIFEQLLSGDLPPGTKALVIAPTRELAVQIEEEAQSLNGHMNFSIASIFGGVSLSDQANKLNKGLDVVVGTPGRLLDLASRGILNLREVGILIIDEADRLFDMGFLPDIRRLLKRMPPPGERQTMLFSATLNTLARRLAYEYMDQPEFISVTPKQITVDTIDQEFYRVKSHIKMNLLIGLLQARKPQTVLIFTNMKHSAANVARDLAANGFRTRHLTGDLSQVQRLKIMDDFKAGKFAILVATDVAARGLHIDGLEMVVNYDLPEDYENYVHRIGRTARAGQSGKAVSLASEKTEDRLAAIEKFINMKIPEVEADLSLFATDHSLENRPWNRRRDDGPSRRPQSRSGDARGRKPRSPSGR
jgi:ATP-dependent RNA helicase RhlB